MNIEYIYEIQRSYEFVDETGILPLQGRQAKPDCLPLRREHILAFNPVLFINKQIAVI